MAARFQFFRRGALLCALLVGASCAPSRYRGPSLLAGVGALLATGGALSWGLGDRDGSLAAQRGGVAAVSLGLGALLTAGAWAALRSQCETSADCPEEEICLPFYTSAGQSNHCVTR